MQLFNWRRWLRSLLRPQSRTYRKKDKRGRLAFDVLESRLAPATWGGTSSALWSNGANWSPNGQPAVGAPLVFNAGASNLSMTDDIATASNSFSSLTFGGTGYSVAAANTLSLTGSSAIIVNNGVTATTISANLNLNNGSFASTITLGTGDTLTITGQLTDALNTALTVTGQGTLILSGSNSTFTGSIDVAGGATLEIENVNALGSASVTVQSGSGLEIISPSTTTFSNSLILNGGGPSGPGAFNTGALINDSAAGTTITWSGTISLDSNTTISDITSSVLNIQGAIGQQGGVQWLTKQGTGEVILGAANTYGGAGGFTFVDNGVLDVQNSSGLGAGGQDIVSNYDTVNNQKGTLQLDDPGNQYTIAAGTGAVESGQTVTITTTTPNSFFAGQTVTIAGFSGANAGYNGAFVITGTTATTFTYTDSSTLLPNAGGGTATVYSGLMIANQTLQIDGPGFPAIGASFYNDTGNNVWAGNIQFVGSIVGANGSGTCWIQVNASTFLTVSGDPGAVAGSSAISSTGTANQFIKTGTGTLVFTTPNSYSIPTDIGAGVLEIEDSDALGSSSITVSNLATLELAGGLFSRELLMLGTAGQELSPIAPVTIQGNILSLNLDSVTGTTDSMQVVNTLSLTGIGATIGGATQGALWSFSGINTYTGKITLNNTTDIGVSLPGTNDNPDTVTASPLNYDVLPNGLATDDTLTIAGNSVINTGLFTGSGAVLFQKVGLGQLILLSPNPSLLESTEVVQGWITIGMNNSLGAYQPTFSINSQPYLTTVDEGGGLFLLPLSATAQDEQETVTVQGDANTNDQFNLYFDGKSVTVNVGAPATGVGSVQSMLASLTSIANINNIGVTAPEFDTVDGDFVYLITFEGAMSGTFEPQIIASSVSLASTATITSNITAAGSGGNLNLGTTYVLSGSGPTLPYILSNLPGYNFIGSGGGAVMNLAGVNNFFGNVELSASASIGVEQAYSSDTANPDYSPNFFSQLTTTGPITQTAPPASINVSGSGSGNEHETDQLINVGSTSGIATINTDVYSASDDIRVYYGNETSDPSQAVLLYDSSNAPYPTESFGIATATDTATKVVTITTTTAEDFVAGEKVVIAGVSVANYNGSFTITSIVSPTSFTYTSTHASMANATGGTATVAAPNNANGAQIVVTYGTTSATTSVTEASEFGGTVGTNWDGAGGVWVTGNPGPTVNYNASFNQIEVIINQVVNGVGNTDGSSAWKDTIGVVPTGVTSPAGITKIGSQRLILQGADTFPGPVDIQQGVILAQNSTSLGTAAGTNIASASEAGTTVSLTINANINNLAVGQTFQVAGVSVNGYNGSFVVTALSSLAGVTTIKYTDSSGLAPATKGIYLAVSTTTVESGAALELANSLSVLNGGIQDGLQVVNEQLILRGAGDPVFGDAPLTVLSSANPSYFAPANDNLNATTDQLWQGPVSLDTYATSFSVALPSTTPSYALTGTGANGLLFSTQSLELGGTLAAGDTFDLMYNGSSQQVFWTSNVPTLTQSIQTALNNLFPTNTPTVTAFGANIYNFTFPSTVALTPLTFTTDGTSNGLTVTSYQVLTFGAGNLLDGVSSFTLGYGSTSTSFLWSSNVTSLTSNIQIALNQLFAPLNGTPTATVLPIAAIGASGTTGYGVIDIAAGSRLTISGTVDDVANPDANGSDLIVYGSGDGAAASSELVLSGTNIYRGSTDALQGIVLVLENNSALGATGITEVQTLTIPNSVTSSFTLNFNGFSEVVPYSGTVATQVTNIETALAAMNSITGVGGAVTISSATASGAAEIYTLVFGGTFLGFNEPLISASSPITVAMLADGGGGTEVASGASLELEGNLTVAAEPVEIAGNGIQTLTPVPTQWFQLGPSPILSSGDNSGSENTAGQVTSISYDPTDATGNTIFVTTADGGAWKTLNGGATWQPLFDYYNPSLTVAIATATATSVGAVQTVTITTTAPHGYSVGQEVTIANVNKTGYNGTYTIASVPSATTFTYIVASALNLSNGTGGSATYNAPQVSGILSVAEVGTTVTVTTAAPHSFLVGQQVEISGVSVSAYDGTFVITAVTNNTFTYTVAAAVTPTSASGGTAALLTPIFAGYIVAAQVTAGTMPNTNFPYVLYMGTGQPDQVMGVPAASTYSISSAGASGTTVTITTTTLGSFYVGESVTVAGVSPSGYDGTFTITAVNTTFDNFSYKDTANLYIFSSTVAVAGASATGLAPNSFYGSGVYESLNGGQSWTLLTQAVNITTATSTGTTATITTKAPDGFAAGEQVTIAGVSVNGYNGPFTIASILSSTSFTYTIPAALAAATGGTVAYAGTNGQLAASESPNPLGYAGTTVSKIVVDPSDSSTIYVAVSDVDYSGAIPVANITSATTGAGTTATIITQAPNEFAVGQMVTIAGVNVGGYNGTYTITGILSANSFTYSVGFSQTNGFGGTATDVSSNVQQNPDNAGIWKYVTSTQTWTSLTSPNTSTISNISVSGATSPQTVTVTTSTNLGLSVGQTIAISGDSNAADNVTGQVVTSIGINANNQPYFTFIYTFTSPVNPMVNDFAPSTALVAGTPQNVTPAQGGHPVDIETVAGSETLFVNFATNPSSITASGVTLSAVDTAGTNWSLTFSNVAQGNVFTLSVTVLIGGVPDTLTTVGAVWNADPATLEASLTGIMNLLGFGLAPVFTVNVTITETTSNPQYFEAGQPVELLEAQSNVGPQNQSYTVTSVSSTQVIYTNSTWGLTNSTGTLTGFDYGVDFYEQTTDYSDLWVYVDPANGSNRFIAFAEGTPYGGSETILGGGTGDESSNGPNRFSNGVYISLNNGETYQEDSFPTTNLLWVTTEPSTGTNINQQTAAAGVIKFAGTINIANDGVSTVFSLYASLSTTGGGSAGMEDTNITWTAPVAGAGSIWIISPAGWAPPAVSPTPFLSPQGNDANATVAIVPSNPNIVFVGGAGSGIDGADLIQESVNGGSGPWTDITDPGTGPSSAVYTMTIQTFGGVNYLLVGTDGGIWRYNISAGTWADLNGNLDVTQFNSIAVSANNNAEIGLALGAILGNGAVLTSGSAPWSYVDPVTGSAIQVAINPSVPNDVYLLDNGTLYYSLTGGTAGSWVAEVGPPSPIVSFYLDPLNPSRILALSAAPFPATGGVYESINQGAAGPTWTSLGNYIGNDANGFVAAAGYQGIYQADAEYPLVTDQGANTYVPNTIYTVTTSGVFEETKNHGILWQSHVITNNVTSETLTGTVTSMLVDPTNSYTVYVTTSTGQIWKTTDAGYEWVNVGESTATGVIASNGLPATPVSFTGGANTQVPGAVWTLLLDPRTDTVVPTGYSIVTASEAGTTVSLIVSSISTGITAGETIAVAGVGVNGYNGTYFVTSVTVGVSTTTIAYTDSTTSLAASSGGTVTANPGQGTLYAGTDNGVYVGIYSVATNSYVWSPLGYGLPQVQVRAMALNEATNTLTIGTYGRGAFSIALDGTAVNGGALTAVSGSAVWTGNVILAAATTVSAQGSQLLQNGVADAQLNIQGIIADATYSLFGTQTAASVIGGANAELTKSGYGNVTFSGANIYSGVTNVIQGVLISDNTQAVSGTATVVEAGTSLELEASLANEAIFLFGDGIATNGHNTGALRSISGTDTYTGTITLMSNATIGADSGATLVIGNGAGAGTITDLGLGYSVTKESTGTLEYNDPTAYGALGAGLAGAGVTLPNGQTYVSGTVVSQGILLLTATGALDDFFADAAPVTYTTVLDGAQVRLQGGVTISENFNLTGSGNLGTGALYSISGANTIITSTTATGIILSQNASFAPTSTPSPIATIGVDNTAGTLTVNGTINQASATPVATITFAGLPLSGITVPTMTGGIVVTPSGEILTSSGVVTSIQTLKFTGTLVGGTFTLKYNGHTATSAITWNANPTIMANLIQACLATITASTTVTFGGLNKVGQGTLILTQNVMASGPGTTTVSTGIVELAATANYGYIVVNSGAAVDISSSAGINATATVTLNGNGVSDGALDNVLGNNSLTGAVILQTNSSVGVENNLTLTILGPVQDYNYDLGQSYIKIPSPPAIFSKVGGGTLELPQASTYTGSTYVNLGVLNVENNTALGAAVTPEVQTISVTGLATASFEFSFTSASPLPINSATSSTAVSLTNFTLAAIQAVLNNLMSALGLGGIMTVTTVNSSTDTFTVALGGTFLGFNQPNISIVSTNLTANTVTTTTYGGGGVYVTSFGTLQLQGPTPAGISVTNKPLMLSGTGYNPPVGSPVGALDNTGTNDLWDSVITLDGATGNTVAIDSSTTATTLNIDQAIGETPAGAGVQLNIGGAGTVEFSGATSDTYTGLTNVIGGTIGAPNLLLNKTGGALAVVGNLTIGSGLQPVGTTEVVIGGFSTQLATAVNVVVNSDGLFDTDPLAQTIGEQIASLTMTGGTVILENGSTLTTPTVTATADANNNPAWIEGAGTLTDPSLTITTNQAGTASPDAIISALIHATTLTTEGAGTLQLTNGNIVTTTNVLAGTLLADDPSAPTLGAVVLNGGTVGGTGTVGLITQSAAASTISPGDNWTTNIVSASETGTVVSLVINSVVDSITVGQTILVAGVSQTDYDGSYVVTSVAVAGGLTTLTYTSAAGMTPATGGTCTAVGVPFTSVPPGSGTETWSNATTFNVGLQAPDNGPSGAPGNSHDWLQVNGNLNINNATLTASFAPVNLPPYVYTIIETSGTISGTFANAPTTGSTVTLAGREFTIAYTPTTVVLTYIPTSGLAILTQPTSTNAGTTLNAVTVQATDSFGNPLTGITITMAIAPGSLSGGTTAVTTNASGLAVFNNLVEDTAGTYSLTASATTFTSTTSSSFTISALAATTLSFVNEPTTTVAGATFSSLTVTISDIYGNPWAIPGVVVSLGITPGSLTTGSLPQTTNAQGQVVFSGLVEDTAGTYTLSASATGYANGASNSFAVVAAVPVTFSYLTQPSSTPVGGTINAVTLQAFDMFSNPEVGVPVSISLAPGALSSGTTPVTTNASGDAIFSNLVENTVGTYTLTATIAGLAGITSNPFTVTPLPAAELKFVTSPSTATAGSAISAVTVELADMFGNAVVQAGTTVTIGISPGALNGGTTTMTTNAQGQVVFSNLVEDTAGTYTLVASATGLTNGKSSTFVVTGAAAVGLAFLTQPTTTAAGSDINPVTVEAVDQFGNGAPGVTVNITSSPGSLGSGTTPLTTTAAGLAVFSDLTESAVGTYTLTAAAAGLTSVKSNSFVVTVASATKFGFTSEPISTTAGSVLGSITVQVEDTFGNPVAQSGVTIGISTTPGTLSGGTTPLTTNAQGKVVFSDLTENFVGTYTLVASATGFSNATSNTFTISPSSASKLAFVNQPSAVVAGATMSPITVSVSDQYGNPLTVGGTVVSISSGPGALTTGTSPLTSNAQGRVVFSDLVEDTAGTYSLTATGTGLTSAASSSFVVSAVTTSPKLTFVTQPANTVVGAIFPVITILATDQFNNDLSGAVVGISISPGSLTTGTTPLTTNAAGEVMFNDLSENTVGTYTLTATVAGGANVSSSSFIISTAPTGLHFVAMPTSAAAGSNVGPVTVEVTNSGGTGVSGVPVSLTVSSGSLVGTIVATSGAGGIATFSPLTVDIDGTYSLLAKAAGLTSSASSPFVITSAAAATLTFLDQPTTTNAVTAINAITIKAVDAFGNLASGSTVTMGITPGSISSGTTVLTTNSVGQVIFTGLKEGTIGAYNLTASTGAQTPVLSSSFSILAGPISSFTFLTEPSATSVGTNINPITVKAIDANGNLIAGAVVSMTVTVGTLGGSTPVTTNAQGQATFSSLFISATGLYTLRATSGAATATSTPFAVTSSSDKLSFLVQPTSVPLGTAVNPVTIQLADPAGDKLPGVTVSIGISSGTLTGTTSAVTNSLGQVTFSGFSLPTTGTFTFIASSAGMSSVASSAFSVTATPAKFVFMNQPTNIVAGSLEAPITVRAVDQFGNNVPNAPVSLTSLNGTLTGTTLATTNASGQAIFTNVSETVVGTFSLTAAMSGISAASNTFTVTPAPASLISFVTQPMSTTAGTILNPLTVKVTDKYGNASANSVVSLFVSLNTVNGTTTLTTNSAGQVVFTGLYITKAGTYTLSVSASGTSRVSSNSFTIVAGAPVVSFVNQPANGTAGNTLTPITVSVLDKYLNPVIGTSVTVLSSSGILSGTSTSATNTLGQVVFNNLSLFAAGSYTLTAEAQGATPKASNSFSITGTAVSHLAFTTGPVSTTANSVLKPVAVQLDNANGTALLMANVAVTLTISSPGLLNGTVTVYTNAQGVATFSSLSVSTKGTFTLTAKATVGSQLLSVVSGSFTIS